MFEEIGNIHMCQKIKISKVVYYELKPEPSSSDYIAVYPYVIKLIAERNNYYLYAFSYWLKVICRYTNIDTGQCQILLEYYNGSEKTKRIFPTLILQKKEITTLLNYGIIFDECYAQKLIAYLIQSTQEAPEVKSYRKLGWINNNDDILRFKLNKLITKKNLMNINIMVI